MRVTVLGGGGFIGTHLSRTLVEAGFDVRVFGRHFLSRSHLRGAEIYEGDFNDQTVLATAIQGAEVIIHLIHATFPTVANVEMVADLERSVIGSVRLLSSAKDQGVRRVLFISSGGTVYGPTSKTLIDEDHPTNPISAYGINKLTIEKYVSLHETMFGLEGFNLRIANPYGPLQTGRRQQGLVPTVFSRISAGKPITIFGDGSQTRDYVFIEDVADAIARIVTYDGPQRCFNIGSAQPGKTILEVVGAIEAVSGMQAKLEFVPQRAFDVRSNVLDCTRLVRETGWRPKTPFDVGVARTVQWLESLA